MAAQEQIEVLLKHLEKTPPSKPFKNIDKNTVGIRAILKYLNESGEMVTAGKISKHMHVSTARVAVLLKKMVAKGLIEKYNDPADARVVIVKLSEYGMTTAKEAKEDVYKQVGTLIDQVGMDKMLEFVAISNEIHSVMKDFDIDL